MVQGYYGLREEPFGMTPDPRYLYLSPTHREALASLLYGITCGRGFLALIAKPGMGKTTLFFHLLQHLRMTARTVFIFQTQCNTRDFMRSLLSDLGVEDREGDLVSMHARLNEVLVRQSLLGKRLVIAIDEAQNLDDSVLEALRMFSNFETPREKLMQIVFAGQPQLADKLASRTLVQLRQRISIVTRLAPLSLSETHRYIDNRLRVAGYTFEAPIFTSRAVTLIATYSEGVPRNINNICFNALSLGCALQRRVIDEGIISEVLHDLDIEMLKSKTEVISHSYSKDQISLPVGWVPSKSRTLLSVLDGLSSPLRSLGSQIKSLARRTSSNCQSAVKTSGRHRPVGGPGAGLDKRNVSAKSSALRVKKNADDAKLSEVCSETVLFRPTTANPRQSVNKSNVTYDSAVLAEIDYLAKHNGNIEPGDLWLTEGLDKTGRLKGSNSNSSGFN